MRAAVYARYSSDLQSAASVEDQVRLCEEQARREGWEVVRRYADHGLSGASLVRPGIQQLLQDATAGAYDLLLAEALDRLSRDQEDIAAIYKRLSFAGVRLVTLAEGPVNELHIGLKGTMNALFLKDLADKTRRGLRGRVEAGKSGGGLCYGYDVVRAIGPDGTPTTGERRISEAEAAIVRRIFESYADGASPRAIAKALNAEAIPGPSGKAWGPSTIHGSRERGTGILNNELYVGRLVWNRLRYVKDPETGRRNSRLNPRVAWIVQEVPELRIIDQPLWDRVKARQDETGLGPRADTKAAGFWDRRRPRFLLSGLVKCGVCGSGFVKISQQHFGCAGARNKGICPNARTIRRDVLEASVLNGLQHHLMDPALLEVCCAEYTRHLNALRMAASGQRVQDEARLQKITRELDRLVDALVAGVPAERVKGRMLALEGEKATLEARLANGPVEEKPLLHPKMGEVYRKAVANLRETLESSADRAEAVNLLRSLIDRIVLRPAEDDSSGFLIDIEGDLAGILSLCSDSKKAARVSADGLEQIKLVAGAGFEPATFRL